MTAYGCRRQPPRLAQLLQRLVTQVQIKHGHIGAGRSESLADTEANAAGTPGNPDILAVVVHHLRYPIDFVVCCFVKATR